MSERHAEVDDHYRQWPLLLQIRKLRVNVYLCILLKWCCHYGDHSVGIDTLT